MNLTVREMKKYEIDFMVDYFMHAAPEFLKGMGAIKSRLPKRKDWVKKLHLEHEKSYKLKEIYYVIWLINNEPQGHSNINNIVFGESATMHIHLWENHHRKSGLGFDLLHHTMPFYFNNFKLKKLISEPYSENIAPNRLLKKVGFEFIKAYETIPGLMNFNQVVNRYEMTKEQYCGIKNGSC